MKYSSIRELFDYWNRPSGAQLVPQCGKVENKSRVSPHHSADGGPGTSPNRLALALLFQRAAKRAFDIVVAIIGLIFFSPIFLLSSVAIKLDSRGPILCTQRRHSYGNKVFRIFTFRCTSIESIEVASPTARRGACVTRIGRILRSSGLDEFPQLINVLRGEMSIVGPRPYTTPPDPIFFQEQISLIARRPNITPGLTGWAQVNGYGDVSDPLRVMRRIEYDLYYAESWSFRLDLKIILMTLCSKKTYA